MNMHSYKSLSLLALLLTVSALIHGENLSTERHRLIGQFITRHDDYEVYSPMVKTEAGRLVCDQQYTHKKTLTMVEKQQLKKANYAYQKQHKKPIYEHYLQKLKAIGDQYARDLKKLDSAKTREEWQRKWSKLDKQRQQKEQQLWLWQKKQYKRIENEANAIEQQTLGGVDKPFYLYVIHSPKNENEPIVPLQGRWTTPQYLKEFNQSISPFLSRCGDIGDVKVLHYYKDNYNPLRNKWVKTEQPVIFFNYRFFRGQLQPAPSENDQHVPFYFFDPAQNSALTLAGFRKKQQQADRRAARYRETFKYARGRKPGIVYKLAPFWAHYSQFDIARRIFDGDMEGFNTTGEFKAMFMALADVWSRQCKSQVKSFTTFEVPYEAYAGSSWEMDGTQIIHKVKGKKIYHIDSRFAPFWSSYQPAVNLFLLKTRIPAIMASGHNLMRKSLKEASKILNESSQAFIIEHLQMARFIQQQGCSSATVQQMVSNFLRAANNQPSAQKAGIRFKGAEHESDPVLK